MTGDLKIRGYLEDWSYCFDVWGKEGLRSELRPGSIVPGPCEKNFSKMHMDPMADL